MQFDFFLWPMLVPLIIPLFYTLIYKKKSILDVALIVLIIVLIVIFYWPLTMVLSTSSNIITKFLLFIVLPLIVLYISWRLLNNKKDFSFDRFGITNNGIEKSLKLGFLFIPLMLLVSFIAKYLMGGVSEPYFSLGVISFAESFTEEFFFRGILFLYLSSKINLKIAYITSLLSFILMHPQNLTNPFIISTIVQGVLTLEICRRSKNLAGAWVLHGTNRFFSIVILPLFF